MTPLRQHMLAALQLSGKGERTQHAYVREVRLLAQFYRKSPDLLSEQELQHYFLHRKNVDGLAPASLRICYRGISFFYQHVLQREPMDAETLADLLDRREITQSVDVDPLDWEVRAFGQPGRREFFVDLIRPIGKQLQDGLDKWYKPAK